MTFLYEFGAFGAVLEEYLYTTHSALRKVNLKYIFCTLKKRYGCSFRKKTFLFEQSNLRLLMESYFDVI